MRWWHGILLMLLAGNLIGCAIVQVNVRNPVVGLEKVAIAPFFNLSSERSVNGHEFAEAYYTELQKISGFEVLPVGIADRAIREAGLTMDGPEDALKLAKLLEVDAVVVGAITDYDPYVPRVGLKISWYSDRDWEFLPETPDAAVSKVASKKSSQVPQTLQFWGGRFNMPLTKPKSKVARGGNNSAFVIRGQSPNVGEQRVPGLAQLFEQIPEGNWQAVGHQQIPANDGFVPAENYLPPRPLMNAQRTSPAIPMSNGWHAATNETIHYAPETVYEIVQGPLFGEPRPIPVPPQRPQVTVVEGPEFIVFPAGEFVTSNEIVIEGPMHFHPHAVVVPTEASYVSQNCATASPLPLPLPPEVITNRDHQLNNNTNGSAIQPQRIADQRESVLTPIPSSNVPEKSQSSTTQEPSRIGTSGSGPMPADNAAPARVSLKETSNKAQQDFDPKRPLMSYVRLFDGTDAALVARLEDYLELSGETRTGDVSAFMRRTEFFQKFTAHVMIVEMLSLHGGEAQRRWVLKSRQYR